MFLEEDVGGFEHIGIREYRDAGSAPEAFIAALRMGEEWPPDPHGPDRGSGRRNR
jgi:hypothetical protein